jgi:hypothetical protein
MDYTTSIEIDKMKESPHINGDTDYNEIDEIDIDETKIFWMGTNANLSDTPQEQLESKIAIQEQVRNGVLDEYGLPTGFTYDELGLPKEKQDEIANARRLRSQQIQPTNSQQINVPKSNNTPEIRKKYNNKFERKIDRERMREEEKKREKLERANRLIHSHQISK